MKGRALIIAMYKLLSLNRFDTASPRDRPTNFSLLPHFVKIYDLTKTKKL